MAQGLSVPAAAVWAILAALFLTLVLPLGAAAFLGVKKKISAMPFFVGVLGFFVSQMLLRIPLLTFLNTRDWYVRFASNPFISAVLIGGLTAGLFEETARLAGARLFCKNRLEWKDALSYGLGHGLCEAVLLVGMSYLNAAVLAVLLNAGALESLSPELAKTVASQLSAFEPASVLLGAGERAPAVMFHIFASVLVFLGVRRGRAGGYWLSVLLHTALNGGAVLLARYGNIWVSEGFLWAFGVLMLCLLPRLKKAFLPPSPEGADDMAGSP